MNNINITSQDAFIQAPINIIFLADSKDGIQDYERWLKSSVKIESPDKELTLSESQGTSIKQHSRVLTIQSNENSKILINS
mgnify:CR=1 FL=1